MTDTTDQSRRAQKAPLPPEVLADALHDRTHEPSGRLLHASPILQAAGAGDHCKHGTPRDPNWLCVQCGNEELRQSADADYNAIGTTVTQTDSNHAALLRDLDAAAAGVQRLDRLDAESAAKAIRGLEAQVTVLTGLDSYGAAKIEEIRADRDHLSDQLDEVSEARDRLEDEVARLAKHVSRLEHANDTAFSDRDRLAGEVERLQGGVEFWRGSHGKLQALRDADVLALQAEVARLTSELAAARENDARYLWLRDWSTDSALFYLSVNETYAGKRFKPAEVDAHIDALAAIDAARRAGEGEAK